jgi:hypothetical protein
MLPFPERHPRLTGVGGEKKVFITTGCCDYQPVDVITDRRRE